MDKLEAARLEGMKAMARGVIGRTLQPGLPFVEAYMFRVGECQAAAVVFAAAGDEAMAQNMNALADTWTKIARDA